jgi:uncharacterized protein (TIGR01777 family)
MKIVIAGGTGFIGLHLCRTLIEYQHDVTVLSRNAMKATNTLPNSVSVVEWDTKTAKNLDQTLKGADALINLCGEPIADAPWTENRKQRLLNSRIDTTRTLVEAIRLTAQKPRTLINASGIGFYGPQDNQSLTEESPRGNGFLSDLCVAWEEAAKGAQEFGVRVVLPRIGMVLGNTGGALPKMLLPFRLFMGGPISPGTQHISWIHQKDLSNLIVWLLGKPEITGPVNAVAPDTVSMKEFCRTLGKALHRPSWIPVPEFVLKLAFGEMATVLTTGQNVQPFIAQRKGFNFLYPKLDVALQSLCKDSEPKA